MTQVGKEGQDCLLASVENSDNKDCRPKVLKESKYTHIKFAVWLFGDRYWLGIWGPPINTFGAPKSLQMVIVARKLKDAYSLEGKLWPT